MASNRATTWVSHFVGPEEVSSLLTSLIWKFLHVWLLLPECRKIFPDLEQVYDHEHDQRLLSEFQLCTFLGAFTVLKTLNLGCCIWTTVITSHSYHGVGSVPGNTATAQLTWDLILQRPLTEIHNIWCLTFSYCTICWTGCYIRPTCLGANVTSVMHVLMSTRVVLFTQWFCPHSLSSDFPAVSFHRATEEQEAQTCPNSEWAYVRHHTDYVPSN